MEFSEGVRERPSRAELSEGRENNNVRAVGAVFPGLLGIKDFMLAMVTQGISL
jgi:hypothetical protein